jgi:hypothetical protein
MAHPIWFSGQQQTQKQKEAGRHETVRRAHPPGDE